MNWIWICGIVVILVMVVMVVMINWIRHRCQVALMMRNLWSDHVYWTREYIIGTLALEGIDHTSNGMKLPISLKATTNRLMKNQEDIGNMMGHFYGDQVGQKVTQLLKEHILGAVDIINEIKKQPPQPQKVSQAIQKWYHNADQIADALNSLQKSHRFLFYLGRDHEGMEISQMMHQHLRLTIEEVQARLRGDGSDIKVFEQIHEEICRMADHLTHGLPFQLTGWW